MDDSLVSIPLYSVAHARSGDKGNRLNISLIPYRESLYRCLSEQVTAEAVADLFRFRAPTSVKRYDLPNLCAFNFVIDDVLEGGVNNSLCLDGHGKCLSFHLLSLQVQVPRELVSGLSSTPDL